MAGSDVRVASFGPFRFNPSRRRLMRDHQEVLLGTRAFDILQALVGSAGRSLTNKELIQFAWPGIHVEEANLRVHISSLRKTLGCGKDGVRYIENLVGRGYCFVAPVQWLEEDPPAAASSGAQVSGAPGSASPPPPLRSRIIGREAEVADVCQLLAAGRFVSIVGPGGLGKTTVALATAHRLLGSDLAAQFFLDLSEIRDPGLVIPALARSVGVATGRQPSEALLISHLRGQRALLVLDSCEHLADAMAELAQSLWDHLPELHILVTSREALRIDCERIFPLSALAVPTGDSELAPGALNASPAVEMFFDKVASSGFRGELAAEDLGIVGDICRRLDGIPLAIELVASHASTFGFSGLLTLLGERHSLRLEGKRNAALRHQTLETMLDWSYDLLSTTDRDVLMYLSAFVGDFTLDAAQFVATNDTRDIFAVSNAITRLVNKSLLTASAKGSLTSFRLLDTTREYAQEKLMASGAACDAYEKHAAYYLARLGGTGSGGAFTRKDFSSYMADVPNIRLALERAAAAPDHPCLARLCAASVPVFVGLGLLTECGTWCAHVLARSGPALDDPLELSIQEGLAIASMFTNGNHDTVRSAISRGLELAERSGQFERTLHLLSGQHIFFTRIGDFRAALECAEHCLRVCRAEGDPAGIATAEWMVGCSYHLVGDQAKALEFTERGFDTVPLSSPRDTRYFGYDHQIRALIVLVRTLWLRGKPEEARRVAETAISEAVRKNSQIDLCIALLYVCTIAIWDRDAETADARSQRLLEVAARNSLKPYEMVGLALAGQVDVLCNRLDSGIEKLQAAIAYLEAEEHHILTPVFLGSLSDAFSRSGRIDRAKRLIDVAIERARRGSGSCHLPELYILAGQIEGRDPSAPAGRMVEWFQEARAVARRHSDVHHELEASLELLKQGQRMHQELAVLMASVALNGTSRCLTEARALLQVPDVRLAMKEPCERACRGTRRKSDVNLA